MPHAAVPVGESPGVVHSSGAHPLAASVGGSPQAGASDARLVLADSAKPLTSASTICELTDDRGRTHWTRRRGSCCFPYALPGIERPCASCPRVNDAERARFFGTRDPV